MLELLSEKQTVEGMIIDAKNQLTQTKILDRLYTRITLKGGQQDTLQLKGANQTKMRRLTETIEHLQEILKDSSDKLP